MEYYSGEKYRDYIVMIVMESVAMKDEFERGAEKTFLSFATFLDYYFLFFPYSTTITNYFLFYILSVYRRNTLIHISLL